MKLSYSILIILLSIIVIPSCSKFVDIDPPPTKLENSVIFSDNQAAISAVTGLYSYIMTLSLKINNGAATIYGGLSADELHQTRSTPESEVFYTNSIVANDGTILYANFWQSAYKIIYHTNAILEGLENSSALTDSIYRQLKGEALVMRSLTYLNLSIFFGEVPLVISTNYKENQSLPRTSLDKIYVRLIEDLEEAKNLLGSNYIAAQRTRPNKYTAAALLSRVYLHAKDWVNAELEASFVIENASFYQLTGTTEIANTFRADSRETIWQLMPVLASINTNEGNLFNPTSPTVIPNYTITNHLLSAFETDDQRNKWIGVATIANVTYYYPAKYKVGAITVTNPPTPPIEYYVLLRLAEQYLIRAEARAEQNKIPEARADIDVIRSRAGLIGTIADTQAAVLLAIEQERRIELFVEWGHRWADLKRTNRIDEVLGITKAPNWQTTDALYPLPPGQLLNNPFLIQNPGY
jgi:hypothetical protein